MSDQRLRELERRFQESGLAGDEEAWLRERLRKGEQRAVELAAYLSHPAALAVLPAHFPPNGIALEEWVSWRRQPSREDTDPPGAAPGLAFWGEEALLRSCAAVARGVLPQFEQTFPAESGPANVLEAFGRLVAEPTHPNRVALREAEATMRAFVPPARQAHSQTAGVSLPWQSARQVVAICARAGGEHSAQDLSLWSCYVAMGLEPLDRIAGWIRADLLPWALGTGDVLTQSRRYSPRGTYRTGDRLRHTTFGEGVVTRVRGAKLTVSFDEGGERQLVHRPA